MICNSREQKILEILVENKEIVTGEYLCNTLGVSSRTIRSDIKELNSVLESNGGVISSEKARGYKLYIKDENIFSNFLNYNNQRCAIDNTTSLGRSENIVIKLLINKLDNVEGITQTEIADELFISLSSLKNDMKIVKSILKKYDLTIAKFGNRGIGIEGSEICIRFCIKNYLLSKNNELKVKIDEIWKEELSNHSSEKIFAIVKSNIYKFNCKLSDKAFTDIVYYISIMIVRNSKGGNVVYSEETRTKFRKENKHALSREICNDIKIELGVTLPEYEILYLTKHIVASSSLIVEQSYDDIRLRDEYIIVNNITKCINKEYGIDLSGDEILIDFLGHHLKAAIYRAQYGIVVENSLLSAIKNNYPVALELAVFSNNIIKDEICVNLTEDDIGFIALHFAAALERRQALMQINKKDIIIVCENGVGTSLLLKVKLECKFKDNINVLETIPKYEFNESVLANVHLVISTVPLDIKSEKIIYVKSLLDNDEINLIEDKINGNIIKSNLLVNKFKEDVFFNNLEWCTRDEIIDNMTNILITKGYINEKVKVNIFKREELVSTEIGDLVAIPHDMSEDIKESFIAIGILKKATRWSKENVQVVFFIGISTCDKEEWKSYLEQLYKNIIDINVIKRIIKCQSFEELRKIVEMF